MVKPTEIIDKVQQALSPDDWKIVKDSIEDLNRTPGRHARKAIVSNLNQILVDTAIKTNKPAILYAIPSIPSNEIKDLFSRILFQFISTKDDAWLKSILFLSDQLGKKSFQSRVFALMAQDLIEAGVSHSDPSFIEQGMIMLDKISFRKYRSDLMIDIVPLLIVWAITTRDEKRLHISLILIKDINDISKRAILHSELAKAIATIAVLEKRLPLFLESIRIATEIHQKIRRLKCLNSIIGKGIKTAFSSEMSDIAEFIGTFKDRNSENQLEIISALIEQLLEREKDKDQITKVLHSLCETQPFVKDILIIDLLKKADKSGDLWYFESAMKLQQLNENPEKFPIREIIKAGISVARQSNEMKVLSDMIPIIEINCNTVYLSRVYLQFAQIMLGSGNFESSLDIFGKVNHESENISPYTDCLTNLLTTGVKKNSIAQINRSILHKLPLAISHNAIYRAIIEISRNSSFDEIISHIHSMKDLILLHPQQDSLFLECITILVDRGFLDSHEPGILIKLTDSIKELQLKERAISNIVIKIAQMGVQTKNRDFLQRAVGLTCQIDGQNTRSITLSRIIDEAAILAAQQGDLDLLLRMKEWSNSLLEKDLAAFAMANIIEGIIKYAIDNHSPEALEKAYLIAQEIEDPALKNQLFERIAECFVKIGCILLKEPKIQPKMQDFSAAIPPFERALEIINKNVNAPQISLKIAKYIDVIISYSKKSDNPDFIIPLAMYSIEIVNTLERDAMMSRIIANLNDETPLPGSTDTYEILGYLLQRNEQVRSNPALLNLTYRTLQLIPDPYNRLTGLSNLADSAFKSGDPKRASEILKEVFDSLKNLPSQYQKVMVLADLTTLFCLIDQKMAKKCLDEGIRILDTVEYPDRTRAQRQIVFAIVSLNTVNSDNSLISIAFNIVSKIKEPVDYINSLIAISRMTRDDNDRCTELLTLMVDAAEKIPSPYERASILLDIVPLALQCSKDETFLPLLKKAEILTKSINIQYIADTIRDNIAQLYSRLYTTRTDKKYLSYAINTTKTIDDEGLRIHRLLQMAQKGSYEIPPQYIKIRAMTEKIIEDGAHPNQIASLERIIRTVADRGKEAIFFCNISILFKKEGNGKISKRMMKSAIKEARIIRPLSKRAYIMCDIAMKCHAAGCESTAQEVFDGAIDAATNIRQSSLRDEVFDELGLAIKIMQEI
jgi:tetratricopeptide (TPR) repeat protein